MAWRWCTARWGVNMSAKEWAAAVERAVPHFKRLFFSQSRDQFILACEHMIGDLVRRMEGRRSTYRQLGEADLSKMMVELLGEAVAAAERDQNGHVDITIHHPRGLGFVYLTECKIWNGAKVHRDGMAQVMGYATGREGRVMVLAFFVTHKRMVYLLERLRDELDAGGLPTSIRASEVHPFLLNGAFVSHHEHGSGAALSITHLGCFLADP